MTPIIPPMASMPTTVATMNVRLVKIAQGRIGSTARVCANMKSPQQTRPATPRQMMTGLVHPYWLPPQVAMRTRAAAPASIRVRPHQSMGLVRRLVGRRSTKAMAMKARTPSGRLIQKAQRQETESVSQPPAIGPRMEAMPNMAPMGAM